MNQTTSPFRVLTVKVPWAQERETLERKSVVQVGDVLYRLKNSTSIYDSVWGFQMEMELIPQEDWRIVFPELFTE